jgi:hypothetical protein
LTFRRSLPNIAPNQIIARLPGQYRKTGDVKMRAPVVCASLFLAAALLFPVSSEAQNVVTDWGTIASSTIVANGKKPSTASGVWFAYTSIAVYDAVNAVHHRFQPFYFRGTAPEGTSEEAAAVAAAHRVLVNYFPAQQSILDAQFTASLATIKASSEAKKDGVLVGEGAANALIAARAGDGLEANVPYIPGSGPGVWQPTPPKFLAALTPWLGQMRPFTMKSASQFLPGGPTPLASEEWEDDYNQVRVLGKSYSRVRTPAQTEIGLFWTEHTGQQYARAFGYLAENHDLSVEESARLFAILWTGYADSVIGCFNAKYTYNFWRPVTAIPVGGGNPELPSESDWTSLGTTPNHPEYPAAHGCVTGTVSQLISDYFRTTKVHVVVDSLAFTDGIHTHTFEDTRDLFHEVFWARIYAGFHYHHSLEDGGILGRRVSKQLFRRHFRRLDDDEDGDRDDER